MLLGLGACAAMLPARAATFPDLYSVTVEAGPAGAADAESARRGMAVLLTRVTGREQVAALPAVQEFLRDAESYVLSRAYLSGNEIRYGFNRTRVNDALTQLDLPLWGAERPSTLLWLAADLGAGQRAELMAADSVGRREAEGSDRVEGVPSNPLDSAAAEVFESLADEILRAADERGLPIVLPALDDEDRSIVRFADVWGGFDGFIERAAGRYGVDAVMIARIGVSERGPEIRWTVLRGDERQEFASLAPRAGIDYLANQFAAQLSTVGSARLAEITIVGIDQWDDFGRVYEYVDSLSVVESVDLGSISGDRLVLRVVARGDDAQLRQFLTLDGELALPEGAAAPGGFGAPDRGLVFVPGWRERGQLPELP